MSSSLRSPPTNQFKDHIPSPYTSRKPKGRPNVVFSRALVPHANCTPSRTNHDENNHISPRVDPNEQLDLEKQDTAISSAHICDDSDEDMSFHWEDQDSFLNDLQEKSFEGKVGKYDLDLRVDSLQPAFTAKADSLNVKFAQLMVPVSNRVRSTFQRVKADVDNPLLKGLDTYGRSVQTLARISLDEQRELDNKRRACREKISNLLHELEEEYENRNKLWCNYEQALEEQVNAMKDLLHDAPGRMEKTIAKLEKKQAKELESSQPDSLNMNRVLAQLLGNH